MKRALLLLLVGAGTAFAQTAITPPAADLARSFPVFILPLGAGFYDFELKASIDNFTSGHLVYFFASAVDAAPENPAWDPSPSVFVSTPSTGDNFSSTDGRVWKAVAVDTPIYGQFDSLGDINQIVVIPSKIGTSSTWMYKGNPHLIWSYNRITAIGPERDGAGHAIWNPIVPSEWRSSIITP